MRLLIDTSAYSAFMRGNSNVLGLIQRAEQIFVNAVVLGELNAGFRLGKRFKRNRELLDRFLSSPRVSSLPLDDDTALRYADIVEHLRGVGSPIPSNDLWIAATAMQHGLILVSTDRHFLRVPQVSKEILEI